MANKKITELVQAASVENTDLLLLETATGTRSISYANIKKPIDADVEKAAEPRPFANNAGAHNGIFRGKDLTNLGIEEICRRISNGSFEDLYIGDYFDITINAEGSEIVRCILAGFNMYLYNGDTSFTSNHAVIVTKNCLKTMHSMNTANITEGGFVGSDMWKTTIPLYNTAFGSIFGSHLLSHRTLLTNTVNANLVSNAGAGNTGASSSCAWTDTKLSFLSEIQVYGSNVVSSSLYDVGCDNLQLPLFALDPTAKVCGIGGTASGDMRYYWLRNVASVSDFAYVNNYGNSSSSGAYRLRGVRPIFCIG